MIAFFASCFLSIILAFWGMRGVRRLPRGVLILFSALPMIVVAAIRYDVGEDYLFTYLAYYEKLANNQIDAASQLEILYHLLNVWVIRTGGDFVRVFSACAVLFYYFVFSQIYHDSPYPLLSIFLLTGMGYVFIFFNAMRQMVGCAILLFSVRYVEQKKLIPFMICVVIAAGFHITCLIFAVIYVLYYVRIRPWFAWLLTAVVVAMRNVVTVWIRNLIMLTDYRVYIFSIFDDGRVAYVMIAINAAVLLFLSIMYDRNDRKYQFYFNMQLLALWIISYTGKIVLITRMMWAFGLPGIIAVPMALKKIKRTKIRYLTMLGIGLLYFLYTLYTVGIQNSNNVLPYQTVFPR